MPALSSSKHLLGMGPAAALGLLHHSLSRQFLTPGANGGCERRWWQACCFVTPPARHRLSPGSEQSSTTQGLLAGTENSYSPLASLSMSATFQNLMPACSSWDPGLFLHGHRGIVEMLVGSSLACIVHGSDLFGWKMGCCLQQFCNDPAHVQQPQFGHKHQCWPQGCVGATTDALL